MIGTRLQTILNEKQVTVGELSRRTGIRDQTLYSIIRRDNLKVSLESLIKICTALDISVECFYSQYLEEKGIAAPEPPALTPRQTAVLRAYAAHPELQAAVDRVLGIAKDYGDLKDSVINQME